MRYCITVSCVARGFVRKAAGHHTSLDEAARAKVENLVPPRPFGEPAEVAAAIRFLLSNEAGYITGQIIHVDGGVTV